MVSCLINILFCCFRGLVTPRPVRVNHLARLSLDTDQMAYECSLYLVMMLTSISGRGGANLNPIESDAFNVIGTSKVAMF